VGKDSKPRRDQMILADRVHRVGRGLRVDLADLGLPGVRVGLDRRAVRVVLVRRRVRAGRALQVVPLVRERLSFGLRVGRVGRVVPVLLLVRGHRAVQVVLGVRVVLGRLRVLAVRADRVDRAVPGVRGHRAVRPVRRGIVGKPAPVPGKVVRHVRAGRAVRCVRGLPAGRAVLGVPVGRGVRGDNSGCSVGRRTGAGVRPDA